MTGKNKTLESVKWKHSWLCRRHIGVCNTLPGYWRNPRIHPINHCVAWQYVASLVVVITGNVNGHKAMAWTDTSPSSICHQRANIKSDLFTQTNAFENVIYIASANRPISQIPRCTKVISHNAWFCSRNLHVRISVTKWCILRYAAGALWALCDRPIHLGLVVKRNLIWYHFLTFLGPCILNCIYASASYAIFVSDHGLWPVDRKAIMWTDSEIMSIVTWWNNCSEFWIKIEQFFYTRN